MSQLAKLQNTFQGRVLNPLGDLSTAWVSSSGRANPDIQLSVYTHAYSARLQEVLANDYPVLLMAIGDDQFIRLARDYIQAHPSQYYSLRDFGQHLPNFVVELQQQDADYRDMPWLNELTQFEWTLGQAFDAADDPVLSEQDMNDVPYEEWPELRFILHSSVHHLDLEWNVPQIWQALSGDNPTGLIAEHDGSCPWLIWREDLVTRFRSMQPDEQLALDALREGRNFSQMCDSLTMLMSEEEVPLHIAGLLKGWIAQGLISGIE